MKRLTIDVPASLYAWIKSQCAIRGVKNPVRQTRATLTAIFTA
ncbi:MAG: hypothetical protein WAW42_16300 [Candidatus Competibacteraceae bacterium]